MLQLLDSSDVVRDLLSPKGSDVSVILAVILLIKSEAFRDQEQE